MLVFFESLGWVGGAGKGGHLYGYNNDVIGIDLVQSRGLVHSGWFFLTLTR